nr:CheR family methyltransferase [uncultured Pseudomonas sp.]
MPETAEVREFCYTRTDFERVRRLLYQRAGISLSDSKEQMVYSRLSRRLRHLGLSGFGAYCDLLEHDTREWQEFVNALTTNLTAFFRENHHFEQLTSYLQRHAQARRTLRIWCAASSTGEEPYSLGITCMEALASRQPKVTILASDIDTGVLATACQGIYPLERVEQLSQQRKQRFFLRGKGSQAGRVRVQDDLRALVEFRQINLLDPHWNIEDGLDIIFCRNVMIYFDKPTQLRLLERMVALLRPDGLFFAGHSESFIQAGHLVTLIGRTVYRPATRPV